MLKIKLPVSEVPDITTVVPISKGGTGSSTGHGAVTSMGGISKALTGVSGGVCPLDSNSDILSAYIPPVENSGVTIKGLPVVVVNNTSFYTITNFDSATTYTVSTTSGTVSISNDTIIYKAPTTAGVGGFTVNGRNVQITVVNPSVVKPSVISPINGTDGLGYNVTIKLSNFGVSASTDTHASTDWHISTNSSFSTYYVISENDVFNLTSFSLSQLNLSTTYYVRVRFKGAAFGYSVWSDVTSFTTGASSSPATEEVILIPTLTTSSNTTVLPKGLATDDVIRRLIVGYPYQSPSANSQAGSAYVFLRSSVTNSVTQEAIIVSPTPAANDNFGCSVSMNNASSYVIVGARNADPGAISNAGAAYVYARSGTTWPLQATLTANTTAVSEQFGNNVCISPDSTRAAISVPGRVRSGVAGVGGVEIKLRSGTTWSHEVALQPVSSVDSLNFGSGIAFDQTGTKIAIGAKGDDNSIIYKCGSVYTYTRSGTTWTQRQRLLSPTPTGSEYFGTDVSMSFDGLRMIVGAPSYNNGSETLAGAVYFFTWNTSTLLWEFEQKIVSPVGKSSVSFGNVVKISKNGDRAVASIHGDDVQGIANCGSMATMIRTTSNGWIIDNIISATGKDISDAFSNACTMADDGTRIAASSAASSTATSGATLGEIYIFK